MHRRVSASKRSPRTAGPRQAREALLGQPVALRPTEQILVVDVAVTEAARHGHADLGTAAAHFVGMSESHMAPSCPARPPTWGAGSEPADGGGA